jgi:uncharacterized protein YqiB (DUF1249 family)
MLWTLLVTGSLAAKAPVTKIRGLVRDEKYEKAQSQCQKLMGKTPEDMSLREACADAAWHLVGPDKASLDDFATLWSGTATAKRAHRQAGALALEAAGRDPDKLRDLVVDYQSTLHAEEAQRRLIHADFLVARDAGDAQSMEMFMKLHPEAAHAAMANNITDTRHFEETLAWNTYEAWARFVHVWPDHPRIQEAQLLLADAAFRNATTPLERYTVALDWPDHAETGQALWESLPNLVTLSYRDSDLDEATSSLQSLQVSAPYDVAWSLWVGDVPAVEFCDESPWVRWLEGQLTYPFGRCKPEGEPVPFVVRASVLGVDFDQVIQVRQSRQDPTLDLALRYAPIGAVQAGCETQESCAPSKLQFSADGLTLGGIVGSQVVWWPLPELPELPEGQDGPSDGVTEGVAGRWSGPAETVSALALSTDGARLAVGFCSETLASLYLIDRATQEVLATREGLCAHSLAFSPSDQAVAVVSLTAVLVIDSHSAVTRQELASEQPPQLVAWSLDGDWLAWWSQSEQEAWVQLWAGDEPMTLDPVSTRGLIASDFSLTDQGLRSCVLLDSTYRCWNARTGRPLRTATVGVENPSADPEIARPVAMSAQRDLIAVGETSGVVRLYDGRTSRELVVLLGAEGAITSLVLSQDGTQLAAVDGMGAVVRWAVR